MNWDCDLTAFPAACTETWPVEKVFLQQECFQKVRTARTDFKVFQVFSFVTFIASLKGPCSLFGLTEQKLV